MSVHLPIVKAFTKSLILILSILPFTLTADVYYMESGEITSLTGTHISAGDLHYKLLPTVKVVLESGKTGSLEQLREGDNINMQILTLDRKSYVQTIIQLPDQNNENDSNAEEKN